MTATEPQPEHLDTLTGLSFQLPPSFHALPLGDPSCRSSGSTQPDLLHSSGVLHAFVSAADLGRRWTVGCLVVSTAPRPPGTPREAAARLARTLSSLKPHMDVGVVSLPCGPAVGVTGCRDLAAQAAGAVVPVAQFQIFVPCPAVPMTLMFTLSTPCPGDADTYAEMMGTIARTIRFTNSGGVTGGPQA